MTTQIQNVLFGFAILPGSILSFSDKGTSLDFKTENQVIIKRL